MLSYADFLTILDQVTYPLDGVAPVGGPETIIDRTAARDGRRIIFHIDGGLGWNAELVVDGDPPFPQVEPDKLRLWVGDELVLSAAYIGTDNIQIGSYASGTWESLFLEQRSQQP